MAFGAINVSEKGTEYTIDSTPTQNSTNPVASGGVYSAVSGKAPTSHATNNTTYGGATGTNYGHVKLSSAVTSSSDTGDGVAATPKAVKSAYDLANGRQQKIASGSVTLTTTWSGNDPYTQTVTISGATVTANTKVDLQPDATALQQMLDDGTTALYIVNNNGTLTAYALSAAPTAALTIQVTLTEVV